MEDIVSVFVPAAPNITTGYMVIVSKSEIAPLNMSVEEGFKMIITGGIASLKEYNEIKQNHQSEK